MRKLIKIVATALLSTTLSGAVMAAVDLNDPSVIADYAKLRPVMEILRVSSVDGMSYNVALDGGMVDSLLVIDTSRFTKPQTKNLMDGMKFLYANLTDAAGGPDKLKAKLGSAPLIANLCLDTTEPQAGVHEAYNAQAIKALKDAVLEDPFQNFADQESFLALRGTPSATKSAMGSAVYSTFEDAIAAYERAKVFKDFYSATSILDEVAKMSVKGKSVADLLAKEAKTDWTTAEVRAAKAKAVDKARSTPEQEASMEIYSGLIRAAEDGRLYELAKLPEAAGLDFDDASNELKNPANARQLLNVLLASAKSMRELQLENAALRASLRDSRGGAPTCPPEYRESMSKSVVTSGGSSGSAAAYPSVTELKGRYQHELSQGGSYDQSSGMFTYSSGVTEQVKAKK